MKYTPDDLQIFVLTYNRSHYLEQCLDSLINQTKDGFEIIVINNGSTDETVEILSRYNNIKIVKHEKNIGGAGGMNSAIELADRKLMMIFHDDDVLPPEYVDVAIRAFNNNSLLDAVGAGFRYFRNMAEISWFDKKFKQDVRVCSKKQLAQKCYMGFPLCFSSLVYKSELIKMAEIKDHVYGKIADRPLVFDCIKDENKIALIDCKIAYRLHPNQDSQAIDNGPYIAETIALNNLYYSFLGDKLNTISGLVFNLNNFRHLYGEVERHQKREPELTVNEYLEEAVFQKAATKKSLTFGRMSYVIYCMYKKIKNEIDKHNHR